MPPCHLLLGCYPACAAKASGFRMNSTCSGCYPRAPAAEQVQPLGAWLEGEDVPQGTPLTPAKQGPITGAEQLSPAGAQCKRRSRPRGVSQSRPSGRECFIPAQAGFAWLEVLERTDQKRPASTWAVSIGCPRRARGLLPASGPILLGHPSPPS